MQGRTDPCCSHMLKEVQVNEQGMLWGIRETGKKQVPGPTWGKLADVGVSQGKDSEMNH